jgi:hypothetical protein
MKLAHALFTTLALATSPAFAGGDGGAFNGPTLSPISVPSRPDHPITEDVIANATKICFATGDRAHGVRSVLAQLMDQIFPGAQLKTPDFAGTVSAQDPDSRPADNLLKENAWHAGGWVVDRVVSGAEHASGKDYQEGDLQYIGVTDAQTYLDVAFSDGKPTVINVDRLDTELQSATPIPFVTADYDYQYLFDKWGNVVKTTKVMKNVRIMTDGQDLQFTNPKTKRAVPLVVSAREYAQCLAGEIQNLAAKR